MSTSVLEDGWRGGTRGPIWYFGYGSNMSTATFCGRRGMRPLATAAARLEGYRLSFNLPIGPGERGVANLEREAGAYTHGVLYLLTRAELDRLDRTEGVHVGAYRRIPVEVVTDDGRTLTAITYRSSRTTPGRKPSARYMDILIAGAREHGLPDEYVLFLVSFDLAGDERLEARQREPAA